MLRQRGPPVSNPLPFHRWINLGLQPLLDLSEESLTLMPLLQLEGIKDELERLTVGASGVLTTALENREGLAHEREVLDGRIQVRRLCAPLRSKRVPKKVMHRNSFREPRGLNPLVPII